MRMQRETRGSFLEKVLMHGPWKMVKGCCLPSPARMRSRLLFSVAHLPTIRETSEEMLPGGPGQEPPASPSLDDYVKSICQLAQPTSVLDQAIDPGRPRRPHRPAQACENSCTAASLQDITAHVSGQQPTLPAPGTADPLGWLFGESQEKQPSRRDMPRRTSPAAGPWGPHRQTDSGKTRGTPGGRLCEARAPGLFLARLSWGGYQSSHLLSWTSEQPGRTVASPCSPRTSSNLRTLYSHLPVIHEL
ncbi:PREDICTED: protein DEPP isoform X1 [Galeopterus variegatus]|uniref:Protein DEPP isoform X1 n=1 Tax=Galeopterus variegatus TaxID=482537 RepID=A0ABM0RT33_GALVR|nr:PREDICTED: protein DEPP-like isoform X2 [Galeopterus variegatus]XP_008583774.1 PREDICTED: protein DEPP isoform X1 [Galeopterus variegatus]